MSIMISNTVQRSELMSFILNLRVLNDTKIYFILSPGQKGSTILLQTIFSQGWYCSQFCHLTVRRLPSWDCLWDLSVCGLHALPVLMWVSSWCSGFLPQQTCDSKTKTSAIKTSFLYINTVHSDVKGKVGVEVRFLDYCDPVMMKC